MNLISKIFRKKKSKKQFIEEYKYWDKFIEEVCNKFIGGKEVSPIQKKAAICFWYDAEMNSGGHSGFFDCHKEIIPQELIDALYEIGASQYADNFKEALENGEEDEYVKTDKVFGTTRPELTEVINKYVNSHVDEILK